MLDLKDMRDDARKVYAAVEQFCQDYQEIYSECDEGFHEGDPKHTALMESYQRFSEAALTMQGATETLEAVEKDGQYWAGGE